MTIGLYGVKQTFEILGYEAEQSNKSYSRIKDILLKIIKGPILSIVTLMAFV